MRMLQNNLNTLPTQDNSLSCKPHTFGSVIPATCSESWATYDNNIYRAIFFLLFTCQNYMFLNFLTFQFPCNRTTLKKVQNAIYRTFFV